MAHALREVVDLAAVGRSPDRDDLAALGLTDDQVDAVVAACRHARDLHKAGAHAAARTVARSLDTWFPGNVDTVGQPPKADPAADETDPRRLAALVAGDRL